MTARPSGTARAVDLNADLGEGFADDEALLDRVSSASICCGAHAGGEDEGRRTIAAARARGVVIGAHPGFPDREGFGRRERAATAGEVEVIVREQLERFASWAEREGAIVRFVKPHGALYNQAQRDEGIAAGVVAAVRGMGRDLAVLGLPGGVLEAEARRGGLRFVAEGFADRRYRPDGALVPRSEPGATIDDPDEAAAQAVSLVGRGVETICLHGDDPRAVLLADRLRAGLDRAGVVVRSFVADADGGGP